MKKRIPVEPTILSDVSGDLNQVQLVGSKCNLCEVVFFGVRQACENCGSKSLKNLTFSKMGKVWSYTVQRYPPPPPCRLGPARREDWVPRPVAWVDLPEEVRVLTILDCKPEDVEIGMDVELVVEKGWEDEEANEVIIYKFKPFKPT